MRFVLRVRIRCGSLSITTSVSLLANEFYVQIVMHEQVSLAAVYHIHVFHEVINGYNNLKIHSRFALKM